MTTRYPTITEGRLRAPGPLPMQDATHLAAVENAAVRFARNLLGSRAKRRKPIPPGPLTGGELDIFLPAVSTLSEFFTTQRSQLNLTYFNRPEIRTAYALYFFTINYAKTYQTLLEYFPASLLDKQSLRILDLGSGLGSSLFAALHFLRAHRTTGGVEAVAVDASAAVLRDMRAIALDPVFKGDEQVRTRTLNLLRDGRELASEEPFDLILMVNMINEITKSRRGDDPAPALIHRLLDSCVSDQGQLVVLEPALRSTSRRLCAIHDELLDGGFPLTFRAPCTGEFPCPALGTGEWCHVTRSWPQPPLAAFLDKKLRHDNRRLKYCQLVVDLDRSRPAGEWFTVLSDAIGSGRDAHLVLCGPDGLRGTDTIPGARCPRGSRLKIEPPQRRSSRGPVRRT
ncbi:hypothetical protein JW905_12500 [bacterium]|nr:hypothetical protein [candidate division CSSED10-310 bacterium]